VLGALAIMMAIAMALPIYGGSIPNTYMAVALGWDGQTLGMLTAINMVASAALLPIAAGSLKRLGIRNSMLIGCIAMIVGGACSATFVIAPWQAIIAFSILMGATTAMTGTVPCQAGVAAWFVRRRTMALSILYAVMGLGGFLVVALITAIIESTGSWRAGWWVFVGAGILGILISIFFVKDAPGPSDAGSPELLPLESAEGHSIESADTTFGQAARSPLLWTIVTSMVTVTAGSGFLIAHAQVHLRGQGVGAGEAAATISIMSGAIVIGNLLFGFCGQRMSLKRAQMLSMAIFCAGLLVLANVRGPVSLYAWALLAGIGFGGALVGPMAMIAHYWSTRVFPSLVAAGLICQTIGGGAAAVAAGAYFDAHHSYLPVIYTIVACNVLALLAYLLVKERPTNRLVAAGSPHGVAG
jgi:MFS family permease